MPTADVCFVPQAFLAKVLAANAPITQRVTAFADLSRINTLGMIMMAGSGHIGSSFSSVDIMSWVLAGELAHHTEEPNPGRFFSSKGHDAPAMYAVNIGLGRIDESLRTKLRRIEGLPGHPDTSIPSMITNTGSLGMGISKAKGFVFADQRTGAALPTYVLLGDGELQEGQIYESLSGAVNHHYGSITAIVDWNQIQSDTWVRDVSDLGDIEAKFASFGWNVRACDGNDVAALARALSELRDAEGPGVLIAHTVKGKGVSFMEDFGADDDLYAFHSGAPAIPVYLEALAELQERATRLVADLGFSEITYESVFLDRPVAPKPTTLVESWSQALMAMAAARADVIVLDGDLRKDLGLVPFAAEYPERFIECGIAEQDMVSQAGALALSGLLPVVCSFACFLTTRPHEQILNNASEGTHLLYVGALAGIIPAGPGHSHQAVTDVAVMNALNGMLIAEPFHPTQMSSIVRTLTETHDGPAYLRICSVPQPFDEIPEPGELSIGVGMVLRDGEDVVLLASSAPLVIQALRAREVLAEQGISATVAATPWLNRIDTDWLSSLASAGKPLVVIENHVRSGALGSTVAGALVQAGISVPWLHVCVEGKQACGTNDEALAFHQLDAKAITSRVLSFVIAQA